MGYDLDAIFEGGLETVEWEVELAEASLPADPEGALDDAEFCLDVCEDPTNADADALYDCGCSYPDDLDDGDYRSDFEQASDWLVSAGWGMDEDY